MIKQFIINDVHYIFRENGNTELPTLMYWSESTMWGNNKCQYYNYSRYVITGQDVIGVDDPKLIELYLKLEVLL